MTPPRHALHRDGDSRRDPARAEKPPAGLSAPASIRLRCKSAARTRANWREATRIARDWGYDEINLNVGCPSDRVQSGCFGAVLMERPALVADCVAAMMAEADVPVTVKCRIGVDDQDPEAVLPDFLEKVSAAGVSAFHHPRPQGLAARGCSPKENREIPPLNYDLVLRMKAAFPQLTICINGGITSLDQAKSLLDQGLDGVMIGARGLSRPGKRAGWGRCACGAMPRGLMRLARWRRCGPISWITSRRADACTRSPGTCWGCSPGDPARADGAGCCRSAPTNPARGLDVLDAALAELQAAATAA